MGNRRIGTKRLEAALDNLFDHASLNGINGSPFSLKNPDRYYLEESFQKLPKLNADMSSSAGTLSADAAGGHLVNLTLGKINAANPNFEILGSNASNDDISYSSTIAGIQLQTDGTAEDSIIILPHLDTNQTAWTGIKWGTENKVQWECMLRTDASVADMSFYGGLKLTNTGSIATDANQAFFVYDSTDEAAAEAGGGALTTNANLHFVYSVGGTDYISDLGIAVAAATNYRLGISIDENREPSAWVNGIQYNLTRLSTNGGVAVTAGSATGNALTNDIDLIPYVGVVTRAASAKTIHLSNIKCSRQIFES